MLPRAEKRLFVAGFMQHHARARRLRQEGARGDLTVRAHTLGSFPDNPVVGKVLPTASYLTVRLTSLGDGRGEETRTLRVEPTPRSREATLA